MSRLHCALAMVRPWLGSLPKLQELHRASARHPCRPAPDHSLPHTHGRSSEAPPALLLEAVRRGPGDTAEPTGFPARSCLPTTGCTRASRGVYVSLELPASPGTRGGESVLAVRSEGLGRQADKQAALAPGSTFSGFSRPGMLPLRPGVIVCAGQRRSAVTPGACPPRRHRRPNRSGGPWGQLH
jgi:hypothetical protein